MTLDGDKNDSSDPRLYSRRAFGRIIGAVSLVALTRQARAQIVDSQQNDAARRSLAVAVSAQSLAENQGPVPATLLAAGQRFADPNLMWTPLNGSETFDIAALAGWAKIADSARSTVPDFTFQVSDQTAHYMGLGVQSVGLLAAPVAPWFGVPLSLAGIWVEDALKSLSNSPVTRPITALPPLGLEYRTGAVSNVLIALDAAPGEKLKLVLNDPRVQGMLGFDPLTSTEELLNGRNRLGKT